MNIGVVFGIDLAEKQQVMKDADQLTEKPGPQPANHPHGNRHQAHNEQVLGFVRAFFHAAYVQELYPPPQPAAASIREIRMAASADEAGKAWDDGWTLKRSVLALSCRASP